MTASIIQTKKNIVYATHINTRMFFKNRFQEEDWVRPKLDGVRFRAIGQQHNVRLSEPFNEKEIKAVV